MFSLYQKVPITSDLSTLTWPSQDKVFAGSLSGHVFGWAGSEFDEPQSPIKVGSMAIATLNPVGDRLVTSGLDGSISVIEEGTPLLVRKCSSPDSLVVAVNEKSEQVVNSSQRTNLTISKVAENAKPAEYSVLASQTASIQSVAFQSESLLIGTSDGNVHCCDVGAGRPIQKTLIGHKSDTCIRSLAVVADSLVAATAMSGSICVWDARAGSLVTVINCSSWSSRILFVPGAGHQLVTAHADGSVRCWDRRAAGTAASLCVPWHTWTHPEAKSALLPPLIATNSAGDRLAVAYGCDSDLFIYRLK